MSAAAPDNPDASMEVALGAIRARGDLLLRWFIAAHVLLALALAPVYSTWTATVAVGLSATLIFATSSWLLPGAFSTRCIAGISLQMFCALHIFQLHGMPEMHFFFFTSTTMMIVYQDRRALWPGVLLIIAQHIVFAFLHNAGVGVLFFPEARVSLFKLVCHFGIALLQTGVAATWAGLLARQTMRQQRAEEERRLLQHQLAISERLASMGLLAAGVGHEINNPLAVIVAGLSTIDEELDAAQLGPGHDVLRESLADASTAARRIRGIVRDLRMLSRSDVRAAVDLKPVVECALRVCVSQTSARARVECALEGLPLVKGDEGRLGQVFLNLIVNAAYAIPEGRAQEHRITITGAVLPRGIVQVEIRDTDAGIAGEALRRIFEPFFTTKAIGEGTGLGLSICHRIVTDLGGSIDVESEPGRGTCVRLNLPVAEPGARSPAMGRSAA